MMEMSPALAIFFNDALYNRCKQIAGIMAKAEGVMPKHLIGRPEACFMVISRAVVWKMDPTAVAMSTYQTPGGSIGFEGRLVHAVIENSGKIDGTVNYKLTGDWGKVRGKFKWATSAKGNKYAVEGWDPKDEEGLGVTVTAKVKGELDPRSEDFLLSTFHPRNSTLWALRPEQQIKYAACRAFANTAVPGILLGASFDVDTTNLGGEPMQDITPPKPTKTEFTRSVRDDPKFMEWTAKLNHAETAEEVNKISVAGQKEISPDFNARWCEMCDDRLAAVLKKVAPAVEEVADAADAAQQDDSQAEPEQEGQDEGPSDNDLIHQWGDRLAAVKDVKDVADLRAEGLRDLPEHLRDRWAEGCDARAKAIAEKPRAKNGGAKAKDAEKESPLQRGKRLLPRVDTPDDILELRDSIMEELSTKGARVEWEDLCVTRLKEVTTP